MRRILLACDLDNTLLHSHRSRRENDICVEWFEGREQSFLSPDARRLLRRAIRELRVVPVTTRSMEQYRRIQWPEECAPECAVTTNGAVLLRNGAADVEWTAASLKTAEPCRGELERLRGVLDASCGRCRLVDGMYLFVPCGDGEQAQRRAAAYREQTSLVTAVSGRKLYFFPPGMDKGAAVRRLREEGLPVVCAGDSVIDLPMLNAADFALVPDAGMAGRVSGPRTAVCPPGEDFARFLLEMALRYPIETPEARPF